MIQNDVSIRINRRPAEVFDFICNFESYPQWIDPVKAAGQTTSGPLGVGTRMRERSEYGLLKGNVDWEITAFEPGSMITFYSDLGLRTVQVTFEVTPVADGARVDLEETVKFRSVLRLIEPLVAGRLRGERRKMLACLKQVLEERQAQGRK